MPSAEAAQIAPEPTLEDRVAATIETVGGDPVAAVRALLKAIDDLEADVAWCELSVSRGFTRGRRLKVATSGDSGDNRLGPVAR